MRIEHFGVVAGILEAGKRIGVSADGIELLCNLEGGPAGGAFEYHVFDHVRQAVFTGGFVPGTHIDPHPHR
jgi:hypothetical protein